MGERIKYLITTFILAIIAMLIDGTYINFKVTASVFFILWMAMFGLSQVIILIKNRLWKLKELSSLSDKQKI